uniref:Uncharacterized protein n=1 Tax=Panagrolaimus superbus TaxID=310955 RepID=A0A914Y1V1_9BILA
MDCSHLKLADFSHLNDLRPRQGPNSWKNKHLPATFLSNQKHDFEEGLRNSKSANDSTLSLHIAAYENSIENPNELDGGEKEEGVQKRDKPLNMVEKWGISKHFIDASKSIIQNSFEFPRQQEDQDSRSELMPFSSSQRLLNPNQSDASGSHGLDIAIGTQSYNLVFIEVLRFQNRFFVSAFSDQTVKEVKNMLKDVANEDGNMELYAFYPKANNFTVLKDDSSLSECGFRPDCSNFHQPGIVYMAFGKENPAYIGDPRNKPLS